MELPRDFIELVHDQYEAETADMLCLVLQGSEPNVSVRINRRKLDLQGTPLCLNPEICSPVPWCPDAYYLTARPAFTADPLLHAGAYYVQEASSMYLAQILKNHLLDDVQPVACLDLCAAPGGKSTLLAGLLPVGSLLISNEPMPKRAQVLSENMQKWTRLTQGQYPIHCYVSQNYAQAFRGFTGCFDVIVTDVPCSGEGMFRKDEQAIRDWSLDNVRLCVQRQREILETIWHALKPGGLLVYSTCTFNRFEDEDNARWICSELDADLLEERHFLPGRDKGEGFYIAAIRKNGEHVSAYFELSDTFNRKLKTLKLFSPEFEVNPNCPRVELNYDDAMLYLRRQAIRVAAPKGEVLLTYQGFVLGPGKGVGNRINNLYPQEWRIRSGYLPDAFSNSPRSSSIDGKPMWV